MAAEYALKADSYFLYDGGNGTEIRDAAAAEFPEQVATIVSEEGGVLLINIDITAYNYAIPEGYRYCPRTGLAVSPADWAEKFVKA
jgi:hypothetical protein